VPRISYARSADGVSLAFTVAGGGPALVFVPWVPFSNLRMEWQNTFLNGIFERLARRLTLIHYDGRGTGHSQRDVTDLSPDAMVADLEAVIDRAGAAQVSLLGQYNSCPHAIAYAARHPERVTRMALFGGSGRGWNAMSAKQTQALLSLIEQDWDVFADTAAHQWMGWSAGEAGQAMADAIRGGHAADRPGHAAGGQRDRRHRAAAARGSAHPRAPTPRHGPDPGRRLALAGGEPAARAAGDSRRCAADPVHGGPGHGGHARGLLP
jgi:pimeloyl-ACP methyl ester carboxylesterase